jgi:Tfp pilus assembly protein PilO
LALLEALTEESVLCYPHRLPQWEAVAALSVLLLVINAAVVAAGYRFLNDTMLSQSF